MYINLRNILKRPQLYISIAAFMLCLLGSSLPIWFIRISQGDRELMSAMDLSLIPVFFGGGILLVPFCAAISYASEQVLELQTGFIKPYIIRRSINRYVYEKVVSAGISGALALGGGCLLHILLWHCLAGTYNTALRPDIEVNFAENTLYASLVRTPLGIAAYLHVVTGFAITGAFWSIIGLWIATIIPDTQLVITIPVVIYYLWKSNFSIYLVGVELPDFTGFYNDGITMEKYTETLCFHAILLLTIVLDYKRRIRGHVDAK